MAVPSVSSYSGIGHEHGGHKAKNQHSRKHDRHGSDHIPVHVVPSFPRILRMLFSALLRGNISSWLHPRHFNLISMPTRKISQATLPQGWGFFSSTISCKCKSIILLLSIPPPHTHRIRISHCHLRQIFYLHLHGSLPAEIQGRE